MTLAIGFGTDAGAAGAAAGGVARDGLRDGRAQRTPPAGRATWRR